MRRNINTQWHIINALSLIGHQAILSASSGASSACARRRQWQQRRVGGETASSRHVGEHGCALLPCVTGVGNRALAAEASSGNINNNVLRNRSFVDGRMVADTSFRAARNVLQYHALWGGRMAIEEAIAELSTRLCGKQQAASLKHEAALIGIVVMRGQPAGPEASSSAKAAVLLPCNEAKQAICCQSKIGHMLSSP